MLGMTEDGEDFDHQPGNDQDGGNGNTGSAVYLVGIKHVGVVATAPGHQDKAQYHYSRPPGHPQQVVAVKKRIGLAYGLFIFGNGCVSFAFH